MWGKEVIYNGHNTKDALNFQKMVAQDGLELHSSGPFSGRRNDWRMYMDIVLDNNLVEVLEIEFEQFMVYGDSGYSERPYLEISYGGSQITPRQQEVNTAMYSVRLCVEWQKIVLKQYLYNFYYERLMKVKDAPVVKL